MSLSALTLLNRLTTRARLRHMQALVTLEDLRSMSRAAQAMGMSQPAMTQLVGELERLLEVQLFLRHSRGVDPTPAALDLLPVARRILTAAEEGAARIASRLGREGGIVKVASSVAGVGTILDTALPVFAERYPAIEMQLELVIGQGVEASFASDEFDVICCRYRGVVPDDWAWHRCVGDYMVAVCSARHRLAGRRDLVLNDLGEEAWLQSHVATIARHQFDALVERQGWDRVRRVQIASRAPMLVWSMISQSSDILALMPRSAVHPWLREGTMVALPVALDAELAPIGFYWKPGTAGSTTRLLVETLLRLYPQPEGG